MGNELDVKDINVDKDEGSECEGDAEVQLATGTYNEWLAGQGLLMLLEPEERYDLKLKIEDISDPKEIVNTAEGGNKEADDEEKEKHSHVQKDVYVKHSEEVCDLDNIKEQVAGMLSKEDTEHQSEKKISRLQLIPKLLQEDEVEQSVGKEKAAGGSMPICKMSETKPPDGNASEKTDVKGSTAESLPEKPPLHHKLTGLTLQKEIVDAEENSSDGSDICKISEAQSENAEKPLEGIGKSKETEQTSMQETGEPPTTAENKTEGSSAELQIRKIDNTETRYSYGTVETADTVDKDLSKDEFDSDLVIDEGECDTKGEKQKRVSFKLDTDEKESVKSSHNSNLDSSQELLQTTVTQMTTDDTQLTVMFTDDTHDDDDYLPLSQNVHRVQYVKTDESSDLEWKWSDLEPGDKLQR